ncbi:MAG TPA: efflux RND transporter periplasmic adaptor subunit [Symbiobacteriaceae bacterium]|jgi:HlyD family secretion protein
MSKMFNTAAALLLTAALLAGCGAKTGQPLTTSGTIMATEVTVAAEVAGKVTQVLVEEGQKVKQGDPVAKLDTAPLELMLKQAQAVRDQAEAKLADAKAGARPEQMRQADELANQAQRMIQQATAARDGAQKNHDTVKRLYDQGAATRSQLDTATTQLDTTSAQVQAASAQAQAAQAQADLVRQGPTVDSIKQLDASLAQAKAAVEVAQLNLDRATVKAPVAGTVMRRLVEPGAILPAGGAMATIANLDDLWLKVYVPENQLNAVKLGMSVDISVDAFKGKTFKAEVTQISDKAEFTPRNVQTKEERANTVYATKLKLREGLGGELKPGMPADVTFPADGGR